MSRLIAALLFGAGQVLAGAQADGLRQAELDRLLTHDCGSCHGLSRQGGLGPPLLPADLRDRSTDLLVRTILDGRPGTAMPAWRSLLSEADALWLVDRLLDPEVCP